MRDTNAVQLNANGQRLAIVTSRYHAAVTNAMRDAAAKAFVGAGGDPERLVQVEAPGAFELTALCAALTRRTDIDGILALGCVVHGETNHDQYIAQSVTSGLTDLVVRTSIPIAFGLLTCATLEQARARAGGAVGNKGQEAMAALIETVSTIRGIAKRPHMLEQVGR